MQIHCKIICFSRRIGTGGNQLIPNEIASWHYNSAALTQFDWRQTFVGGGFKYSKELNIEY